MPLAEKIALIESLPVSSAVKSAMKIEAARNKKRGPYACRGLTKDRKAYGAAYYRNRVEAGLCHCCGKPNKDRSGKTTCGKCQEKIKIRNATRP